MNRSLARAWLLGLVSAVAAAGVALASVQTAQADPVGVLRTLDWEQPADRTLPTAAPTGLNKQWGTAYGAGNVTAPVRDGSHAARFELRKNDPVVSGSKRAEISQRDEQPAGADRWYGFSIQLPSTWVADSRVNLVGLRREGGDVWQERSPEDVVACWTLVDGDWDLVANKTGPTRLGFCLALKFFELEGRFPQSVEDVPQAAVEYVAGLVKVPASDFAGYSLTGRTAEYHRAADPRGAGLPSSTRADEDRLIGWLAQEVCPVELVEDRLREAVLVQCRAERIEPPGRIDRIIASAWPGRRRRSVRGPSSAWARRARPGCWRWWPRATKPGPRCWPT